MRVVPNVLSDEIYAKVDAAIAACDNPDAAKEGRERFYVEMLDFFDRNGFVPDFSLVKATQEPPADEANAKIEKLALTEEEAFRGCGAGMGAACCKFLLADDGFECGRVTPLKDHLIAAKGYTAQRLPKEPYPECQLKIQ